MVSEIEAQLDLGGNSLTNIQLSAMQRKVVEQSDEASRTATKLLHVSQSSASQLIDYLRGLRASSEFGLQAYLKQNDGSIRLREVALKSKTLGIFLKFRSSEKQNNLLIANE